MALQWVFAVPSVNRELARGWFQASVAVDRCRNARPIAVVVRYGSRSRIYWVATATGVARSRGQGQYYTDLRALKSNVVHRGDRESNPCLLSHLAIEHASTYVRHNPYYWSH